MRSKLVNDSMARLHTYFTRLLQRCMRRNLVKINVKTEAAFLRYLTRDSRFGSGNHCLVPQKDSRNKNVDMLWYQGFG
jgi:hypothetical protein